MHALGKVIKFVRKNKGGILAVASLIGLGYTVVKTAQEAPKAVKEIEELEEERGRELTTTEKVKVSLPYYVKPVVAGTATAACIIGSGYFSSKAVNGLITACMMGKGLPKKPQPGTKVVLDPDSEVRTFYDSVTGQEFESTTKDIQSAFYRLNKQICMFDVCTLAQYVKLLGIEVDPYNSYFDCNGWDYDLLVNDNKGPWLEYYFETVNKDGKEIIVLNLDSDPDVLWASSPVDFYCNQIIAKKP